MVLLLGLAMGLRAYASESGFRISKPDVRKQVIAVIEAQLAAFRAGDVPKAYSYASAAMTAQNSVRRFAAIVRENYPEIWQNARAEYGLVRDDETHATVMVHVFSTGGNGAFDYVLLRERGGWRIGSVMYHEVKRKPNI